MNTLLETEFATALKTRGYAVVLMADGSLFAEKRASDTLSSLIFGRRTSTDNTRDYFVDLSVEAIRSSESPIGVEATNLCPARLLRHHDTLVDHLIRRYEQLRSVLEERLEDGQEE